MIQPMLVMRLGKQIQGRSIASKQVLLNEIILKSTPPHGQRQIALAQRPKSSAAPPKPMELVNLGRRWEVYPNDGLSELPR